MGKQFRLKGNNILSLCLTILFLLAFKTRCLEQPVFFGGIFGLHSFATLPSLGLDSTRINYMFLKKKISLGQIS
jgi:hypothetical protein